MADKDIRKKTYHYTNDEVEFIKQNWMALTDEQIGERLRRTSESVRRKRDALGLKKPGGRPSNKSRQNYILNNPTNASMATLSKDKRLEYYKESFEDANARYPQLIRELNEGELEYYKHKYVEFLDSVDTLSINEEDMLHHMIMTEVVIHRMRATMKREREAWDDREEGAHPPQNLYPELERAEQRYMKYHKELHVTREQRLKTDKEEKLTIDSIVRSYFDKKNREQAGFQASLIQYSTDKARNDMSKFRYLIGDK
jgi:hypothetical protein